MEPLPRFEMPLCPGVSGLKTDAAEMMVSRIRANAARVDIELAKPNCSPNLVVAFVDDGRALLSKIAETRRERFCTLSASEQAEILAEDAPVRVWNEIVVVGPTAHVRRCRWHVPSKSGGPSQMFLPTRRDIVSALVVFERDAVAGMTLVQLADYATMRGLSHTRSATGDEPMPTILSLFAEGAQATEELTIFDLGYLRSLYWPVPNVSAVSKLLAVRRHTLQEQRRMAALQRE